MKSNEAVVIKNKDEGTYAESSGLIARSFLITLSCVLFALGFLVSTLLAILPRQASRVLDDMGLSRAAYTAHQRVYLRDDSNENLYNVLQYAIKQKDYEGVEFYSTRMLSRKDFSVFASSIDSATRAAIGDRYYVFFGGYENYVRCSLTKAYYTNGKKADAKLLALGSFDCLAGELGEYISCVNSDPDLTDVQKKSEIASFYNSFNMIYIRLDDILASEYLDMSAYEDNFSRALVLRHMISISESKYFILLAVGKKDDAAAIQAGIVGMQEQFAALVETLG